MRTILEIIGTAVVVGLAGGAVGYLVRKNVAEGKIATAEFLAPTIDTSPLRGVPPVTTNFSKLKTSVS